MDPRKDFQAKGLILFNLERGVSWEVRSSRRTWFFVRPESSSSSPASSYWFVPLSILLDGKSFSYWLAPFPYFLHNHTCVSALSPWYGSFPIQLHMYMSELSCRWQYHSAYFASLDLRTAWPSPSWSALGLTSYSSAGILSIIFLELSYHLLRSWLHLLLHLLTAIFPASSQFLTLSQWPKSSSADNIFNPGVSNLSGPWWSWSTECLLKTSSGLIIMPKNT